MVSGTSQNAAPLIDLAFVSLWTPNIVDWCASFTEIKRRYCEAWGFAFHGYDQVIDESRPPHWSKILALQAHLEEHDWLFWIDADAVVANFAFDLRTLCDPTFDLIVTHDFNGLNNGTFLIRNSETSREFLRRVWKRDIRDRFLEQTAMAETMAEMPELQVEVLPKRSMNSYWDDYEFGDFIFHVPGEGNDTKRKLLRVVANATGSGCLGLPQREEWVDRSSIGSTGGQPSSSDGSARVHGQFQGSSADAGLSLPPLRKTIWQTYRSREALPKASLPLLDSWRDRNPDWEVVFHDDKAIRELFENHLPLYLDLFDGMPMGVMKADLWRYAVIFVHGGLYADIDTGCNMGLNQWLRHGKGGELHVACENNHPFFCQWAFAAPAGHPALLKVLELISNRIDADGGVNSERPDFVHYYTGPGVWTAAIQEHLGSSLIPAEIQARREIWAGKDIQIYPEGEFCWGRISHANASHQWGGPEYPSWRSE